VIAKKVILWSLAALLGVTALTATFVALSAGLKAYKRAEQRADPENRVRITRIDSERASAQALVARARSRRPGNRRRRAMRTPSEPASAGRDQQDAH